MRRVSSVLTYRGVFLVWSLGILLAPLVPATLLAQTAASPRAAVNGANTADRDAAYEAGDVQLDSSRVFIFVHKAGFGHDHAVAGRLKQGRVVLDENRGGGELVFDMPSFDADSDEARRFVGLTGSTDASTRKQVNANMHGAAILGTKLHPTATFKITSVARVAETSRRGLPQVQLDGDFTLRGVTNPIRVVADVEAKDGWLHVRGGFAILQTSYGIRPFKKAFGAVGVADRLDIWGDLWIAASRIPTSTSPQ